MIVVGISAKMGCGKTTLSSALLEMLNGKKPAVRLAFGDVLKRECSTFFKYPLDWNYSQAGKELNVPIPPEYRDALCEGDRRYAPVRRALQWYGTDYRRAQDPEYWTKAMRKELVILTEAGVEAVVVDDVRFPNEAQVCLDNGYCFRVEPFPGWQPGPHADHASETALDSYDKFTKVYRPGFGLAELHTVASDIANYV